MPNEPVIADQPAEKPAVDLSKLVGFASVGQGQVDFRDETLAARVGAKIGSGETNARGPA